MVLGPIIEERVQEVKNLTMEKIMFILTDFTYRMLINSYLNMLVLGESLDEQDKETSLVPDLMVVIKVRLVPLGYTRPIYHSENVGHQVKS